METQTFIVFVHTMVQTGIVFNKAIKKGDKSLLNKVFEYEEKVYKHAEDLLETKSVFRNEAEKLEFIREMLFISSGFSRLAHLLRAKKLEHAEEFVAIINDFAVYLEKIESMGSGPSILLLKKIRGFMKSAVASDSVFDYAVGETLEQIFFSIRTVSNMIKLF